MAEGAGARLLRPDDAAAGARPSGQRQPADVQCGFSGRISWAARGMPRRQHK